MPNGGANAEAVTSVSYAATRPDAGAELVRDAGATIVHSVVHGLIALAAIGHIVVTTLTGAPLNLFVAAIAILTSWWSVTDFSHGRRLRALATDFADFSATEKEVEDRISFEMSTRD